MILPALALIGAALLQSVAGRYLTVFGVVPNVVLLMVAAWGFRRGWAGGLLWGIVGGFALDLFSAAPLGTHVLALSVAGFVAGFLGMAPIGLSILAQVITGAGASLAAGLTAALVLILVGWPIDLTAALPIVLLPSMLTDGLLFPFVAAAVARAATLLGPES